MPTCFSRIWVRWTLVSPPLRMAVELHLPDLPEVPLSLGPAGPPPAPVARALPWHLRLRDLLSAYLPLLLMALLALSTWWLVKNTPTLAPCRPAPRCGANPTT